MSSKFIIVIFILCLPFSAHANGKDKNYSSMDLQEKKSIFEQTRGKEFISKSREPDEQPIAARKTSETKTALISQKTTLNNKFSAGIEQAYDIPQIENALNLLKESISEEIYPNDEYRKTHQASINRDIDQILYSYFNSNKYLRQTNKDYLLDDFVKAITDIKKIIQKSDFGNQEKKQLQELIELAKSHLP